MGIDITQLASAIAENLETYSQNVVEEINQVSNTISKKAVKRLKETSPKNTGDYAKGWAQKENKTYGQPSTHTLYNKTHYRLTHLLENGHAKVNGGRVQGQPHIGTVEQEVIEEFEEAVRGAIRNG